MTNNAWLNGICLGMGLALSACGGGGGHGGHEEPPDMAEPPPDLALTYPKGPYAGEEGKVFPNHLHQGYFSPTATRGRASSLAEFGEIKMERVHRSGAKYALIQLGAYWCTPCKLAARTMAMAAPDLVPKGGFLMSVVTQGTSPQVPATKTHLDQWIAGASMPFTATLDTSPPGDAMEDYFGVGRDSYIMVDLATMKIERILTAADGGVKEALKEFEALLDR